MPGECRGQDILEVAGPALPGRQAEPLDPPPTRLMEAQRQCQPLDHGKRGGGTEDIAERIARHLDAGRDPHAVRPLLGRQDDRIVAQCPPERGHRVMHGPAEKTRSRMGYTCPSVRSFAFGWISFCESTTGRRKRSTIERT